MLKSSAQVKLRLLAQADRLEVEKRVFSVCARRPGRNLNSTDSLRKSLMILSCIRSAETRRSDTGVGERAWLVVRCEKSQSKEIV